MGATPSSLDVRGRRDVCQAATCSADPGRTGAASVSVLHTLTRKKPEMHSPHPPPPPLCLKTPLRRREDPFFPTRCSL